MNNFPDWFNPRQRPDIPGPAPQKQFVKRNIVNTYKLFNDEEIIFTLDPRKKYYFDHDEGEVGAYGTRVGDESFLIHEFTEEITVNENYEKQLAVFRWKEEQWREWQKYKKLWDELEVERQEKELYEKLKKKYEKE